MLSAAHASTQMMMTLILCCCLFYFGHNNFGAAHNDLMAIVVTQRNLTVCDSDELFSQIFIAFLTFEGLSHKLVDSGEK